MRAHGIPSTAVARTLLDLGGVVGSGVVRRGIVDALQKKLVTPSQLHEHLARCGKKGRPGTATFRRILDSLELETELTDSDLEDLALEMLARFEFPGPTVHHEARDGGVLLGEIDLAYPKRKVGIEVYGHEFHSAKPDFYKGFQRHNSLTAAGWRILYFTYDDYRRPLRFATDLRRVLA